MSCPVILISLRYIWLGPNLIDRDMRVGGTPVIQKSPYNCPWPQIKLYVNAVFFPAGPGLLACLAITDLSNFREIGCMQNTQWSHMTTCKALEAAGKAMPGSSHWQGWSPSTLIRWCRDLTRDTNPQKENWNFFLFLPPHKQYMHGNPNLQSPTIHESGSGRV